MRQMLLITAVLLAGCPKSKPAPRPDASASAVDEGVEESPRTIEEVTLEIVDAPSNAKAVGTGTPLALPGDYMGRVEEPPRWLVGSGNTKISVVDRTSGKMLGALDNAYPDDVQRKHARLPGWQGKERLSAVLYLADGKLRIPRAHLPDGTEVKVERLITDDHLDEILVLAKTKDDKRRVGVWREDAGDDVVIDREAPVDSRAARFDVAAGAFVLLQDSAQSLPLDACAAAFLDATRSECFVKVHDSAGRYELLEGGFYVNRDRLEDTKASRHVTTTLPGQQQLLAAALSTPPRAMFVVNDGVLDRQRGTVPRKFEILAPDGSLGAFHLDIQVGEYENSFTSAAGNTKEPIVAEKGISQLPRDMTKELSSVFVDLERGRVVRSPMPLDTLTRSTAPRRFLAVERGKPKDTLYVVDLDGAKPKATKLGAMPSCPGPYWPSAAEGTRLALVCSRQPNPDLFSFIHLWSEVVATDTMKRWHVDGDVVDLWPTGEVLRSAPARVHAEGASPRRSGLAVVKLD